MTRQQQIRDGVAISGQVQAVNSDRIDKIRESLDAIAATGDRAALKGIAIEILARYL